MVCASAEERFVAPDLVAGAAPYDENKPENLNEDQLYSLSAILIREDTGEPIFEKDADTVRYPASTTKIMTLYLGILYGEANNMMDQKVTASEYAVDIPSDASSLKLKAGEEIRFEDLLYGTMITSGNDGATVIAEAVAGSEQGFANMMNEMARMMGCTNTHFVNAHGLHDDNHYTTARDMAIIARNAMQNDLFRRIVGTTTYLLPKSNLQKSRTVYNSGNRFMLDRDDNEYFFFEATGIKTGYTLRAGYCYVGSAVRSGISLISVTLYSGDTRRFIDTRKLMEYGFAQYESLTPVELYRRQPIEIEATGYSLDDADLGRMTLDLVPVDAVDNVSIIDTKANMEYYAKDLTRVFYWQLTRSVAAPIEAGEVFGKLTYYPEGRDPVEYNLVASRSIAKRANAPKTIAQIEAEALADRNPLPPLSIELLLLILIPAAVLYFIVRFVLRLLGRLPKKRVKLPKRQSRRFS